MDGRESKLSITTSADGKQASVSIVGDGDSLLSNLTVLTRFICRNLRIPLDVMTCVLPVYICNCEIDEIVKEAEIEIW